MFRSVSAALVVGLAVCTPPPAPTQAPQLTPGPPARAPIVDVRARVIDIELRIGTLDESIIDADTPTSGRITMAADVLFAFDKATVTAEAGRRLAQAATILKREAGGERVRIDGHTDAKGGDAYNRALSLRRAEAVERALTPLLEGTGITFAVDGHGATAPVADNTMTDEHGQVVDNPKGRAKNRRVEIAFSR
ncbi:OmpA family protein [Streptosporangium sp. NPDC002721]|uniref:OmpA family protein n=1 Tax=Streptosporangium sp. NPDC002721 TaxID=3366188 RepID=UPI00367703EC